MINDQKSIKIILKNRTKALDILTKKYPEYRRYRKYEKISTIFPNEIIQISLAMQMKSWSKLDVTTIWSHCARLEHLKSLLKSEIPIISLIYKTKDIPHSINLKKFLEKENLFEYKDPDWKKFGVNKQDEPQSLYLPDKTLVNRNYGDPITIYSTYTPSIYENIEGVLSQFQHYRIDL